MGMKGARFFWLAAAAAVLLAVGCGEDGGDPTGGGGGPGTGGTSAGTGSGGTAASGTGGAGGTSATAGTGGGATGGNAVGAGGSGAAGSTGAGGATGAAGATGAGGAGTVGRGGATGAGGTTGSGGATGAGGTAGGGGTGSAGRGGTSGVGGAGGAGGSTGAAGTAGRGGGGGGSAGATGSGGTAGAGGRGGSGGAAGTGGSAGGSSGTGGAPPDPGTPIGFATLNGGTTGGRGAQTVTVTSYADLKSYAESATAYIIRVQGTISNGSAGGRVSIRSNKSIIGIGNTAFLSGVGLEVNGYNNVIIQNLRMTLVGTSNPSGVNGGDVISISGTSRNIWIDHCELYNEDPATNTDIDKYDGLIDIKGQTGFITISWNYLHDHHKGGLVGAADDDLYADRKITFHHNYYNRVKLRIPMYRGAVGHFFNNYIVGAQDATEIRADTCVRVEKNYYEALHYSIYTTSDSEGNTQRIDNVEVSRTTRAYPPNCTADIPYSYSSALTNTTNDVKTIVPQGAGVGKI
jgi:pectate lyase